MRLRPLLLTLLAVLLAGGVLAVPAGATVVRVVTDEEAADSGGYDREDVYLETYTLRVAANVHERNRVAIRVISREEISVTDRGSRGGLHVGRGCRRRSPVRAVCAADDGFDDLDVVTKDGADTLSATGGSSALPLSALLGAGADRARVGFQATVDGGPGDDDLRTLGGADTLVGGAGDDRLDGGRGADVLAGGTGRDRLRGGPGNDALLAYDGQGLGRDAVDGGPGRDTVTYAPRRHGVRIVLGAGGHSGGALREDTYASVENAVGGRGDDRITGDAHANRLSGGDGGHDVLRGLGGDDALTIGDGDDRAAGGDGDDLIDGAGGSGEADCGAGADVVSPAPAVLVRPGCEALSVAYLGPADASVPLPVSSTPDALTFAVTCASSLGCPSWQLVLRRAAAGPAWAAGGPGTDTDLVRVALPAAAPHAHVTVAVPRAGLLPAGLPVSAGVRIVSPGTTSGYDLFTWGLLVP